MKTVSDFMSEIHEKGWTYFPGVVDTNLLSRLKKDYGYAAEEVRKIQIANGIGEGTEGTVNHLLGLGDSFLDFLDKMYLHEYLEAFLGGKYIVNIFGGGNLTSKPSPYIGNIHRDLRTFTGDFKMMIQFLVMVDDFTLENGATYFLNGSHKQPQKPDEDHFFKNAVRATGKAGGIVVFDSNLWHAAGVNKTDQARLGLTINFTRPFVKQHLDLPRYFGFEKVELFSENLKQVLGYYSRSPSSFNEWYQPPEKRFYRPGQG